MAGRQVSSAQPAADRVSRWDMTDVSWQFNTTAEMGNLPAILDFATACCQQGGVDEQSAFQIRLAVDEAVANVIQHAYENSGGRIEVSCWIEGGDFYVQVRDWGRPFAPEAVPQPDLSASLTQRHVGGLGLHFMRKLMDEVRFSFSDEGNDLTMVKRHVAS
jgi:serine/threonine-protein kinase RsbW